MEWEKHTQDFTGWISVKADEDRVLKVKSFLGKWTDCPLFGTAPLKTSTKTSQDIRADGRNATLTFVQNEIFYFWFNLNFGLI